jgi:S-ribosylhomocysteine lyase
VIFFGAQTSESVYDTIVDMCKFILDFEGDIPGAKPEECGNYSEQNLNMAKYYIRRYLNDLTENKRFVYPK